jgi:hypothetical protein
VRLSIYHNPDAAIRLPRTFAGSHDDQWDEAEIDDGSLGYWRVALGRESWEWVAARSIATSHWLTRVRSRPGRQSRGQPALDHDAAIRDVVTHPRSRGHKRESELALRRHALRGRIMGIGAFAA